MILLLKLKNDWLVGEVKELPEVELGDPDLELTNPVIWNCVTKTGQKAKYAKFLNYIPDDEVSQCRLRFMDCDTMMEPGPKLKKQYLEYVEVLQQDRTSG